MTQQTAVEYFKDELIKQGFFVSGGIYAQAKAIEKEQCIKDYNVGYMDAQCNHINDAGNYADEQEYVK